MIPSPTNIISMYNYIEQNNTTTCMDTNMTKNFIFINIYVTTATAVMFYYFNVMFILYDDNQSTI